MARLSGRLISLVRAMVTLFTRERMMRCNAMALARASGSAVMSMAHDSSLSSRD